MIVSFVWTIILDYCIRFQMISEEEFDRQLQSMQQQAELIAANRAERNRKYTECMNAFKEHLSGEANALEDSAAQDAKAKERISSAFQNSFQRLLGASDVTVRKVKRTFQEKKEFWDNVIKMNAGVGDLELKKQFYQQKHAAEERYFDAIDQQKDKRKQYRVLVGPPERKEPLRDAQQSNKNLQQRVTAGTALLQHWKNGSFYSVQPIIRPNSYYPAASHYPPRPESSVGGTVINQFVGPAPKATSYDGHLKRNNYNNLQSGNKTDFLSNFIKKE